MAKGIEEAIARLVEIEEAISGVRQAYDKTPENPGDFPYFINYPARGTATCGAGGQGAVRYVHTIRCELHLARKHLPEDERQARPYIEDFIEAIFADPTLNDTVDHIGTGIGPTTISYEYGYLRGWKPARFGIVFTLEVKINKEAT